MRPRRANVPDHGCMGCRHCDQCHLCYGPCKGPQKPPVLTPEQARKLAWEQCRVNISVKDGDTMTMFGTTYAIKDDAKKE